MAEVHVFVDSNKSHQWGVKSEFLKKCPNPHEYDCYDLLTKFQMAKYLHNPGGPAIMSLKNPEKSEFWLDGKKLSKEEGEKMAHNFEFNNRFIQDLTTNETSTPKSS